MFRILILLYLFTAAYTLPNGWLGCKKSDPEYSDCLSKEIIVAVNSLAYGHDLLQPLIIDKMTVVSKSYLKGDGPVSIKLFITNGKVYGVRHIIAIDTKNDWKTMHIRMDIEPKLQLLGTYTGEGEIFGKHVKGQGGINIIYENVTLDADIIWKRVRVEKTEYFSVEFLTMSLVPERFYITLDNFYNGYEGLAECMDEDWKVMLDELNGSISEGLSSAYLLQANPLLFRIPAYEIDI